MYRFRPLINTTKLALDNKSLYWAKSQLNSDGTIRFECSHLLNEFIFSIDDLKHENSAIQGSSLIEDVYVDDVVGTKLWIDRPRFSRGEQIQRRQKHETAKKDGRLLKIIYTPFGIWIDDFSKVKDVLGALLQHSIYLLRNDLDSQMEESGRLHEMMLYKEGFYFKNNIVAILLHHNFLPTFRGHVIYCEDDYFKLIERVESFQAIRKAEIVEYQRLKTEWKEKIIESFYNESLFCIDYIAQPDEIIKLIDSEPIRIINFWGIRSNSESEYFGDYFYVQGQDLYYVKIDKNMESEYNFQFKGISAICYRFPNNAYKLDQWNSWLNSFGHNKIHIEPTLFF